MIFSDLVKKFSFSSLIYCSIYCFSEYIAFQVRFRCKPLKIFKLSRPDQEKELITTFVLRGHVVKKNKSSCSHWSSEETRSLFFQNLYFANAKTTNFIQKVTKESVAYVLMISLNHRYRRSVGNWTQQLNTVLFFNTEIISFSSQIAFTERLLRGNTMNNFYNNNNSIFIFSNLTQGALACYGY